MTNVRAHSFISKLVSVTLYNIPGATTALSSLWSLLWAQPGLNKLHFWAFVTTEGCRDWYWSNCSLDVNVWSRTSVWWQQPPFTVLHRKHSKQLLKSSKKRQTRSTSFLFLPTTVTYYRIILSLCTWANNFWIFSTALRPLLHGPSSPKPEFTWSQILPDPLPRWLFRALLWFSGAGDQDILRKDFYLSCCSWEQSLQMRERPWAPLGLCVSVIKTQHFSGWVPAQLSITSGAVRLALAGSTRCRPQGALSAGMGLKTAFPTEVNRNDRLKNTFSSYIGASADRNFALFVSSQNIRRLN